VLKDWISWLDHKKCQRPISLQNLNLRFLTIFSMDFQVAKVDASTYVDDDVPLFLFIRLAD
jgi:hypothetical protein